MTERDDGGYATAILADNPSREVIAIRIKAALATVWREGHDALKSEGDAVARLRTNLQEAMDIAHSIHSWTRDFAPSVFVAASAHELLDPIEKRFRALILKVEADASLQSARAGRGGEEVDCRCHKGEECGPNNCDFGKEPS